MIKLCGEHMLDRYKLRKDPVIVDGGACVGDFIKDLKQQGIVGKVYSFEPCKTNYSILMEKNYDVKLYNMAIVAEGRAAPVMFTEITGKNGRLREWGNTRAAVSAATRRRDYIKHQEYEVDFVSINNIHKHCDVEVIDYMKLDIEGDEMSVLSTMTRDVADRILQISVECHGNIEPCEQSLQQLGYYTITNKYELYGGRSCQS